MTDSRDPDQTGARDAPAATTGKALARDIRLAAIGWLAVGLALLLAFLVLLTPVLTPFALGAVLAYVLRPGAAWLQGRGLGATVASLAMVIAAAAAMLGLVLVLYPLIEREATALNSALPGMVASLDTRVSPLVERWLGLHLHFDPAALRSLAMQEVGQKDLLGTWLTRFGSGGASLLGSLAGLVLVPVVLFYLLRDGGGFFALLEESIPTRWRVQATTLRLEIDSVLAQFLRGQLTVMLCLAVYYSVALSVAGIESALAIGMLTGLLIFIPYAGFALGLTLASLVAVLQDSGWQSLVNVLIVYGAGQVIEGFVLTPRLVGERIGLHPLAVIFALLAFGNLFGFFGVLLALPFSAALLVGLRRVRTSYLASSFYRRP